MQRTHGLWIASSPCTTGTIITHAARSAMSRAIPQASPAGLSPASDSSGSGTADDPARQDTSDDAEDSARHRHRPGRRRARHERVERCEGDRPRQRPATAAP
jgi:hypothetical protein